MPVCADGKVFDECGSPCPLTCSNYSLPCPYHDCVSGCFCPGGTVELDDGCVPYKACPCKSLKQNLDNRTDVYNNIILLMPCMEVNYSHCFFFHNNYITR